MILLILPICAALLSLSPPAYPASAVGPILPPKGFEVARDVDAVPSPQGDVLLLGTGAHVLVWDMRALSTRKLFLHKDEPVQIAFAPDGTRFAAASGSQVTLRDARTLRSERTLRARGIITSLLFSTSSPILVVFADRVDWWDLRAGKVVRSFEESDKYFAGFALSPDLRVLATFWHAGETFTFADIQAEKYPGKELRLQPDRLGQDIVSIAFSADGRRLAGLVNLDRGVYLWDLRAAGLERPLPGQAYEFVFSLDGKLLAGYGNEVTIWDVETGTVRAKFAPVSPPNSAAAGWRPHPLTGLNAYPTGPRLGLVGFLPGSRILLLKGAGSLHFWDWNRGRLLVTLLLLRSRKGASPDWIAFTPEGYYAASPAAMAVGDPKFHAPAVVRKALTPAP